MNAAQAIKLLWPSTNPQQAFLLSAILILSAACFSMMLVSTFTLFDLTGDVHSIPDAPRLTGSGHVCSLHKIHVSAHTSFPHLQYLSGQPFNIWKTSGSMLQNLQQLNIRDLNVCVQASPPPPPAANVTTASVAPAPASDSGAKPLYIIFACVIAAAVLIGEPCAANCYSCLRHAP